MPTNDDFRARLERIVELDKLATPGPWCFGAKNGAPDGACIFELYEDDPHFGEFWEELQSGSPSATAELVCLLRDEASLAARVLKSFDFRGPFDPDDENPYVPDYITGYNDALAAVSRILRGED